METVSREGSAAGIVTMCAGVACLSVNDAIAKVLMEGYSPLQIMFLRNLIALPFAVAIALAMGGAGALRSIGPLAHLLRGVLWVVATALFLASLRHMGLAEATALVFASPLFITAISALVLGAAVGWRRWLAVMVGFAGVLLVVRPETAGFGAVALMPVGAALVYAILMLSARLIDPRESVWTLLLYLTGASAVLLAGLMPLVWVPVAVADLWLFAAIAILGTAGITMITQSFRLAPAVVVAPLDYTALLWALALGWLIWSEMPDAVTLLGAGIIVASGIVTVLRREAAG